VAGLALLTALALTWRPATRVEDVVIEQNKLRAVDAAQKTVWTFKIPDASSVSVSGPWRQIADLDGDGHREVLVALSVTRPNASLATGVLYCFSDKGELNAIRGFVLAVAPRARAPRRERSRRRSLP
jgi:hypothetical protein